MTGDARGTHRLVPHDPGHEALKAAVRLAVVPTVLFAFGDAIANGQLALYAAFGSIALLVFAQFGGPPAARLRAYALLALAGVILISLGTLASHDAWIAGASMAIVAFVILMAGILNGYVAAGTNAALLSFVISVMIPVPAAQIPDRLGGWALAAVVATAAVVFVWPARGHDQVRADLAAALRALADMVAALAAGDRDRAKKTDASATCAIDQLRRSLTAVPYRPTGATGPMAALSRLVADVGWLRPLIRTLPGDLGPTGRFGPEAVRLETEAVGVLRASASTLERGPDRPDVEGLERAREETARAFATAVSGAIESGDDKALAKQLEQAFRLRTLSYGTWQIGVDSLLAAGRPAPEPDLPTKPGPRLLLREHLTTDSVWFRNSLRGAVGLGLAVLVGQLAELQHSFWVVLGTLSVLRSNALATGSTILLALAGTVVGILAGGGLVALIGGDETLLWIVLPFAFALAGYAPRAISFAAGQAAFTVVILILFDLISPAGWETGLLRIEDIAIGSAISFAVGLLFWPRGAAAVVRQAIAAAYDRCAEYVAVTTRTMLDGGDEETVEAAARDALGARVRLDDALHQYLGERSAARLRLDNLGLLAAGATRLRRVGDALRSSHVLFRLAPLVDASPALRESRAALEAELDAMQGWYAALGDSVERATPPPRPHERLDEGSRILSWVRDPNARGGGDALPPGLALAWAGEHVDALRLLEPPLAEAADALTRPPDEDGST